MKRLINQVHEFHKATGAAISDGEMRSPALQDLRERLLRQEVAEASDGIYQIAQGNIETGINEMIDGCGDTLYIVAGTVVAYGWRVVSHRMEIVDLSGSAEAACIGEPRTKEAHLCIRKMAMSFGEYLVAESNNRLEDIAGPLADMARFARQAIIELGYDPRAVTDEIHASNMSKLVKDEQAELATAKAYDEIGVKVEFVGEYPMKAALSAEHQDGLDGKDYPRGKVLKAVGWNKPDFTKCRVATGDAA